MKQLLLLAVIHLLIFHQYKKDKSEVLASKKNSKPVEAMVIPGEKDHLSFGSMMNKTNETNDSLPISVQSGSLRPIHASYLSPAIPAISK